MAGKNSGGITGFARRIIACGQGCLVTKVEVEPMADSHIALFSLHVKQPDNTCKVYCRPIAVKRANLYRNRLMPLRQST